MLPTELRIHLWRPKIPTTEIQDGGRRHLGFWKTVASCLLTNRSTSNLVRMLQFQLRVHIWRPKCPNTEIQDGGGCHLEFRKTVAISLLLDRSASNLMRILQLELGLHLERPKCATTGIQDGGRQLHVRAIDWRGTRALSRTYGTRLAVCQGVADLASYSLAQ